MKELDRAVGRASKRLIVTAEGPDKVNVCYLVKASEAKPQRLFAAERLVMEKQRRAAFDSTGNTANRARVGTWLTPREHANVDVATGGQIELTQCETLSALRSGLSTGRIEAALLSAALMRLADVPTLSALIHDFPANPVVGFIAEANERQALCGALVFGQAGVATLVDVRSPEGWSALRGAFDARRLADPFIQFAVRAFIRTGDAQESVTASPGGWARFLAATFSPRVATAMQVAESLGVRYSTLNSRFFRAGLPSPKCYLAHARLVWAARLGEAPGLPISAIADRLQASSPQSFGRTVRTMLGITATDFRRTFDGEAMLAYFRTQLIEPYRETLSRFDPLAISQAEV